MSNLITDKATWTQRETISVEEAAALLGIGRTAAYDAVRRGEIPALAIGRRRLVPVAQLRRLLGHLEKAASTC